ncbi:MAG: hypothetical protein ABI556_06510, partial [Gemmatimonadales bacterium]
RNVKVWVTSGLFAAAAGGYLLILGANSGRSESKTASEKLSHGDQILVGDFDAQPRDSLSARAVSEMLRTSLGYSHAVSVVSRVEVDRSLRLMQLPVTSRLDRQLAQDLAIRSGYEAVLGGAITPVGKGYVLSARVTTPTGKELLTLSETAGSDDLLIPAIDRLSKSLRRTIGESASALDSVRPLAQVTTRSLRALKLFTQAQDETRAGKATSQHTLSLLREAIADDSTFAMAHRFLGIKLYLLDSVHASIRSLRRAERFSDHLTDVERFYALSTLHLVLRDYVRALDEAEAVWKLDPKRLWALNQIGILDNFLGRHAHSRETALKRWQLDSTGRADLPIAAIYAGQVDQAIVTGRELLSMHKSSTGLNSSSETRRLMALLYSAAASFDSAEFYASPRGESYEGDMQILAYSQLSRGQMAKAFATLGVRPRGAESRAALPDFSPVRESAAAAATMLLATDRKSAAKRLNAVLADAAFHSGDPADRFVGPVLALSLAGRAVDARHELQAIESALDSDMEAARYPELSLARGAVALAENRPEAAIGALKYASSSFTFSDNACRVCALPWLGRAYEAAAQPDSALVVYERFLSTGDPGRVFVDGPWRAVVLRRLADLYAERGDVTTSIKRLEQFVMLWKEADRDLQPQVTSARKRLAELQKSKPLAAAR